MGFLRKYLAIFVLGAIALIGLYACGGEAPTATPLPPTATPAPPPPTDTPVPPAATAASNTGNSGSSGSTSGASGPAADLINKSVQAMSNVNTVHMSMTISSNAGTGIGAEGDVERPGKSRITMQMGPLGAVEMISIDNQMYTRFGDQG